VNIPAYIALGLGLCAVVGLIGYLFSLSHKDDDDEFADQHPENT